MSFCARFSPCLRQKETGTAGCVKELCDDNRVEPRESPQPTYQQFTKVGEGNGKYEVEMRYDFVGEGNGRFNKGFTKGTPADEGRGRKTMRQLLQSDGALGKFFGGCLVALAIVAVLVLVGLGLMESSMGEFLQSQKPPSLQRHAGAGKLSTATVFHSNRAQAAELRSRAQAALSPALVVQPVSPEEQAARWALIPAMTTTTTWTKGYDCGPTFIQHTDLEGLLPNWGAEQRMWCCLHHGRGCSTTATGTSTTGSTTTGSSTTRTSTTRTSTTATSSTVTTTTLTTRTTTTRTTTTTEPYNCEVDRGGWEAGWSPYKKTYCCQHHDFGCPTTTAEAYECSGPSDKWSFGHRYWCCWHHKRGCGDDTARHFDTTTTPGPRVAPLPPAPAPAVPFDCLAGSGNWRLLWSPSKKGWCCANAGIGCEDAEGA